MNDNEIITFKNLVLMNMQQLTNFPYIEKDFDALTDYELLCLVVKYLNDVINNSNEQNTHITNLYKAFLELKNYVDSYFDEKFPDAINEKIDDLVADGTIENLLNNRINLITQYKTFSDVLENAASLSNGLCIHTNGYYNENDGGESFYKITDTTSNTKYQENLNNGLYAELITNDYIRVSQFGAKGDGETDDTDALQKAFDYAQNNKTIVFEYNKTYMVDTTRNFIYANGPQRVRKEYGALVIKGYNVEIMGNSSTVKAIVTQADYDNDKENFGSVLVVSSGSQSSDEFEEDNSNNFNVQCGQHVLINNLNIDGGSYGISQTYLQPNSNHLNQGKGIMCESQNNFLLEIIGGSIKNTFAEGMTGGSANTSVICRGVTFGNSWPSCQNVSGKYELVDGCYFENRYAMEMNPGYEKGIQIVKNCYFKYTYNESDLNRNQISAVGYDNRVNSEVIIKDNTFDITYQIDPQQSLFYFNKCESIVFDNNIVNITCNSTYRGGRGALVYPLNINKLYFRNNYFTINKCITCPFFLPSNITYQIASDNIYEVRDYIDTSDNSLLKQDSFTELENQKNIYHGRLESGATVLLNNLDKMNGFNRLLIKTNKYIELTNFNIRGYNISTGYDSMIGGAQSMNLSKTGKMFNLDCINENSNKLFRVQSDATSSALDIDFEFYS